MDDCCHFSSVTTLERPSFRYFRLPHSCIFTCWQVWLLLYMRYLKKKSWFMSLEGEHLGWPTSSCPILCRLLVQHITKSEVLLLLPLWLNLWYISNAHEGFDSSLGSFTQLTDKWLAGYLQLRVISRYTDFQKRKNSTSHTTYPAAGISVVTFAIHCGQTKHQPHFCLKE